LLVAVNWVVSACCNESGGKNMQRMKPHSLAFALAGVIALGGFQTTGFAADLVTPEVAPRYVHKKHWRGKRVVVAAGCIEVSQPPRGCPVRLYGRLPWPLLPRPDAEFAEVEGGGWHRCWWGEWC
jgi:hypothetical protein